MPVFLLELMPAQEFAEWQAYLQLVNQVDRDIADKVDPQIAWERVWTPPADDDDDE